MFYRIRNYIINLDRVIGIHLELGELIVNMDNGMNYHISLANINSSELMSKIQTDLPTLPK